MKNQIYRSLAIFIVLLGFAGVGAQAQTASKVEVEIPFAFTAGKTTLEAGVYSIKRGSGNLLLLSSKDGESGVILNAPSTLSASNAKAGERLVFDKDGDQYFLTQVWLSVDSGRQVFTKRTTAKSERVEISLKRPE
jgi:hypothetical protein